jgi:hypothetical protein
MPLGEISGRRDGHHDPRSHVFAEVAPWTYWGLEPYRRDHPDHDYRHAMLFQAQTGPNGRSVTASRAARHDSKA